jgi:hypothetical protein
MNLNDFIKYVETSCKENDVELVVTDNARVHYNSMECSGFFDPEVSISLTAEHIKIKDFKPLENKEETKKVLAFSKGGKSDFEVLSLLAHEYSHMCQYQEKSKLWISGEKFAIFDNWLSGIDYEEEELNDSWKSIVLLEADCEKRTLELIKKLKLDIDEKQYAKTANAYLYFYTWCKKNRAWYKTAPYQIKEIVEKMHDYILDAEEYVKEDVIDKKLMKLFDKCAY